MEVRFLHKSSETIRSHDLLKHTGYYRWEKQVQAGGTHREKLAKISTRTLEKFMQAKRNHMTLHDIDIRRWALSIAKELHCDNFKASPSWVLNFKKAHNIVSRKVTKFVSRTDVQVSANSRRHSNMGGFSHAWE